MGRPLNKKYFGNFNIGTGGYTPVPGGNIGGDDGIGGEGLASITTSTQQGVVLINSSYPAPILVKPAPSIPGGVQSTSRVIWEVDHIALTTTSTNYTDTLPTNVTFTGLGGGVIGRMTATNGPDHAATTAGINFNDAGANRGEFINTPPTAALTYEVCTAINVSGGGDNAQCQVFFRVKRIEVLEKGSGYRGTETFSWNTAGCSGSPFPGVPTLVLTTDSGGKDGNNLNVATNQDNAIIIHANVGGEGGTLIGDIREQVGSRRYRVKTSDGVAVVKLVASNNPGPGEAYILATDHTTASYWVTKLTAHRATVIPRGDGTPDFAPIGVGYNSEVQAQHVGWTFGTAHATSGLAIGTVKIENA
jgi:hypothetical protein